MLLPETWKNALAEKISCKPTGDWERVSGGCINQCYRISCGQASYFLKCNSASAFPGMFEKEAHGLHLLHNADCLRVPAVYQAGAFEGISYLLLEWIPQGANQRDFWKDFGTGLARLHSVTAPSFGLDTDNYIGSLPQSNTRHKTWAEFFIVERLLPQIQRAHQMDAADRKLLDRLFPRLSNYFPPEAPALLHGDLWSGNYLSDQLGNPVLIDPAVYFGHREADLAMMHLFGGFPSSLFDHYQEHFPLSPGWKDRLDLYNLYPLLVHLNLFGTAYLNQIRQILRNFA